MAYVYLVSQCIEDEDEEALQRVENAEEPLEYFPVNKEAIWLV